MTEFLIFLGTIFLIVLVIGVLWALYAGFKELIDKAVWRYRYKHRFDKPPTAKCYCIDCKRHNNETGRCYRFKYESGYQCTADNWFCWEAEPKEDNNG